MSETQGWISVSSILRVINVERIQTFHPIHITRIMFGFGGSNFAPDKDVPNLEGKVFLITGGKSWAVLYGVPSVNDKPLKGNIGLGRETILQLSKHKPAQIYLGARSQSKAEDAIASIKKEVPEACLTYLPLDLTAFDSIKGAADTFKRSSSRLDVLVNNAGIMACPPGQTTEGYEIQFGTNHVGHALLTSLLLPTLQSTAVQNPDSGARIINLTSEGHRITGSEGLVLGGAKTNMAAFNTWRRYGQSKLANILFNTELAKRYPEIESVAIHPGSVRTNLQSGPAANYPTLASLLKLLFPLVTVDVKQGALNQIWASTAKASELKTGSYYVPVKKLNSGSSQAQSERLSEELWSWTEKELASHGHKGFPPSTQLKA